MNKHPHPEAALIDVEVTETYSGPQVLVVVRCPHCSEFHEHGAGHRVEQAVRHLGHRVALCGSVSYWLVNPAGLLP